MRLGMCRCLIAVVAALLPAAVGAEEDCGLMVVSAVHFGGTIRVIEPLGKSELLLAPSGDLDAHQVVSVTVETVEPQPFPDSRLLLEPGRVINFQVHSPARTFGRRAKAGSRVDLEGALMQCDGRFRRFVELRRWSPPKPEKFTGTLEVGSAYRAKVRWDAELAANVLAGTLDMPMHQEGDISFVNPEAGPKLSPEHPTGTMDFEVLSRRTEMVGERAWEVRYTCRIIG